MRKINLINNPFSQFCINLGFAPTSYSEALTYEEQILWLIKFLEQTVIPSIQECQEAVIELQGLYEELKNYVDHYFDNLDVQEEINNKLDEMAEQGTLQEIITSYLQVNGVLAYNTISDMCESENLINGSTCYCLGEDTYNDGKGAFYKVREIINTDVVDGFNIVALDVSDELIAERINNNFINYLNINNSSFNYKFKNIDVNVEYYENTTIYSIVLNKINSLQLKPISGDNTNPNSTVKSIYDYAQTSNNDILINASVENLPSHEPVGICIFNGISFSGSGTPPYYCCFDEDNSLILVDSADVPNANYLLNLGIINAFGCFEPIIKNGSNFTNSNEDVYNDKHPRQIIAEDNNGNLILISVMGRNTYNQGLTYSQLKTYLSNKNIKNAICCDGGGSTQTVLNKKSLFTSIDPATLTGRVVSTALCIDVSEVL